jgi:lysophospholipase L1-like esterase
MAGLLYDRKRLGRLVGTAFGLAVAALAMMIGPPWLNFMFTRRARLQITIGFLIGLGITYTVVVVGAVIGALAFGGLLYKERRERTSQSTISRGLLLCISCLLAAALAEGAAAARRAGLFQSRSLMKGIPKLNDRFAEPNGNAEATIAVLGESSAFGMPYDQWLSVGKIVAWQLEQSIATKRFRVETVAQPGDTLEGQYQKLASLRRRADVLIVYCGHNEFADIAWSRTVDHYRDHTPAPLRGLDELANRVSPLYALIRETADKLRVALVPPHGPRPPLVDQPAYTPSEHAARLEGFRSRLEAIAVYGRRIGALTVLVVPPSNDAGFDPNRSFLPAETTRAQREAFARDFLSSRRSEDSEPARAIELYRTLLDRQPGFAETHYRLGLLLDHAGAWDEAYRHFVAARDLDGLPMRCLSSFQQVYRDVATKQQCILVDGQELFHAIGPHGLIDDHLFHDAMHPSLLGHIALAQAIMDALRARRAFGWPVGAPQQAIDPVRCALHFGLQPKDWKTLCERGGMFYFATSGLRYDRTQRLAKQDAFKAAAQRIAAGVRPEAAGLPNIGASASLSVRPDLDPRARNRRPRDPQLPREKGPGERTTLINTAKYTD